MSLTTAERSFARRTGTLWRDTGQHVLALPEGDGADVVVLGGGGAVLWRVLERPHSMAAILSLLGEVEGSSPSEDEVHRCLDDLVSRGLVHLGDKPTS